MGATIIDSLDTLHIMGLTKEFEHARDWVEQSLHFDHAFDASVFETTIRVIGGLMSANHLTGDAMFAKKAEELAERLLPAFRTETSIPYAQVNDNITLQLAHFLFANLPYPSRGRLTPRQLTSP